MINDGTFAAIVPLLEVVNTRELVLSAHPESAVEYLDQSVVIPNNVLAAASPETHIDLYRDYVSRPYVSKLIMEGNNLANRAEHEDALQYIRENMRVLVDSTINRAINLVQPFYTELVKSAINIPTFERGVKNLYNLQVIEHYEGWSNEWCQRLLNQYSSVQRFDFFEEQYKLALPKTEADTAVVTNLKAFDDMLSGFNAEFLVSMHDIFTEMDGVTLPPVGSMEAYKLFDKIFYILLAVSASDSEPWVGSGVGSDVWDSMVAEIKVRCSSWIIQYLELLDVEAKEGTLVRLYDFKAEGGATILINPISNTEFITKGGSPEAIYGMMLAAESSKEYFHTTNEVFERKDNFVQIWDDFVVAKRANDASRWLAQVKAGLTQQYRYALVAAPEGLFEGEINIDEKVEHFSETIERSLNLSNVDDIDNYLFTYLGEHVFKGEDTIRLLADYDYFLKDGLTPEKAQEQAVIQLVYRWVAPQVIICD